MSRTYRKSKIKMTKKDYVDREIFWASNSYDQELYMTQQDVVNYNIAMDKYHAEVYIWERSGFQPRWSRPVAPEIRDFKRTKYTKKEYDEKAVRIEAQKEYDKFYRDGKLNDTGRKQAFKKICKKKVRAESKSMIKKIMSDDECWDENVFPSYSDGKQYVWHVW